MKFHSKRASTKIKNVKEGYPSNNKIHIYILAHLISINFLIITSTNCLDCSPQQFSIDSSIYPFTKEQLMG